MKPGTKNSYKSLSDISVEGKNYKEAFITSDGTPIALAKLEGRYIFPFRVFNN